VRRRSIHEPSPPKLTRELGRRELTRRELVRALSILAAGAALPTLEGCAAPSPAQLASLLPSGDAAAVLGAAYRAAVPVEATAEALADAILSDLGWPARRLRGRELGERLLAHVRDDHAADRVVSVEGWTLARTEARLVALRSLVR
jgi:hypothetical protein